MTNKINVVPLSPDRSPANERWLFQLVAEVHAGQCTLELLAIWTLMETSQTMGQTWGHRLLPVDCALIAVGNTSTRNPDIEIYRYSLRNPVPVL